jgi:serine/threonine protein kinase
MSSKQQYSSAALHLLLKLLVRQDDEFAALLSRQQHCVHPVALDAMEFRVPRPLAFMRTLYDWQACFFNSTSCPLAPELFCRSVFKQLLRGLQFLHQRQFCAVTVAPEDCLFEPRTRKLVFTGFSSVQRIGKTAGLLQHCTLQPDYQPPELLLPLPPQQLTERTDSWSAALTMLVVATGTTPYSGHKLREQIYARPPHLVLDNYYSDLYPGLRQLLRRMLLFSEDERLSAAEALRKDRWLLQKPSTPLEDKDDSSSSD